jgi:hypothetical protein
MYTAISALAHGAARRACQAAVVPGLVILAGLLSATPARALPSYWVGQAFFPVTVNAVGNRVVHLLGPAQGGIPQGWFLIHMAITPLNAPHPGPNGNWLFAVTDFNGQLIGVLSGVGSGVPGTRTELLICNPLGCTGVFTFAQGAGRLYLNALTPGFATGVIHFPVLSAYPTFVFPPN